MHGITLKILLSFTFELNAVIKILKLALKDQNKYIFICVFCHFCSTHPLVLLLTITASFLLPGRFYRNIFYPC